MAKIKSGDLVQVISVQIRASRRDSEGSPKENRVIVEGVKVSLKHNKANPDRRGRRHSEG